MKLRVAFIDDGINTSRFSIPMPVTNIMIIDNGTIEIKESQINPCSHGTICAAVFCEYANSKNVELICLKVLNSELRGKAISLIEALNWCVNNNVNIVNCSLGTTNKNDFGTLNVLLNNIKNKKTIIVASKSNKDIYTYPACDNNVIGVKSNSLYMNGNIKLKWYPFDGVEVETSGVHTISLKDNSIFKTPNANSFSTPVVTALIADIIDKYGQMPIIDILKKIEKNAVTVLGEYLFPESPYPWSQNSIIAKKECYEHIVKKYIHKYYPFDMVPIVKIYGDDYENEIMVIKSLEYVFLKNKINYYVVSDQYDEMRLKYIYIPTKIDGNTFANNVFRNFECEIIIAHTSMIKADISIFVTSEILKILYDDKCDCFMCTDENSFIKAMEHIYNVLL